MRIPRSRMLLLLATASTFGVCGSAYSAQPDTQIRQAEFSTIVFFVVFAVLTLLISFWAARRATSSSEYLTAEARSHQARMAWPLRATICRPATSLAFQERSINTAWIECSLPRAIWPAGLLFCFLYRNHYVVCRRIRSQSY